MHITECVQVKVIGNVEFSVYNMHRIQKMK